MKIYDFMQLNAAASKTCLKQTKDPGLKRAYLIAFICKNFLCILFCMTVVTLYSYLFGSENSIVGVVVLISVMVFRFSDLGIQTTQAAFTLFGMFVLLAVGPQFSNWLPAGFGFLADFIFILTILFFSCHNLVMSNHSTFVLGYLLLQGYTVSGTAYVNRVLGLLLGGMITALIFYIRHRHVTYRRTFSDLLKEWNSEAIRTKWQMKLTLGVSLAILIGHLLSFSRPMWLGFACMSVIQPFQKDMHYRLKRRAPFMVLGCLLFGILYVCLPKDFLAFFGILGGILVGFSGTYEWQTVFNCLGALSVAVPLFGPWTAIFMRIFDNVFASVYCFIFDHCISYILNRIPRIKKPKISSDCTDV